MAFKHISLLRSAKGVILGLVGDTAFLPGQKYQYHQVTWVIRLFCPVKKKKKKKNKKNKKKKKKKHITTFGALGGLAFDYAYDIK